MLLHSVDPYELIYYISYSKFNITVSMNPMSLRLRGLIQILVPYKKAVSVLLLTCGHFDKFMHKAFYTAPAITRPSLVESLDTKIGTQKLQSTTPW